MRVVTSWLGSTRPSTPWLRRAGDQVKPGHDDQIEVGS